MSTASGAPRLTVADVRFYERDAVFRMPFRFGVVTLTEAPQAFVRLRVRLDDGREGWGLAAELLAPKWFDKDPALSNEQNFGQLRSALATAAALYAGHGHAETAFGLHAACYGEQIARCGRRGLDPLVAGFGPALLDRAVLDALCRLEGMSIFDAMRANRAGLDGRLTPDLEGFDIDAFLTRLAPAPRIHARHTVGLVDPITADDLAGERVGDGLPETLEEVVATYGNRYFKVKVGGDRAADLDRLQRIAAVLDAGDARYHASLDGNEQYHAPEEVAALWQAMAAEPRLDRLLRAILFIEQPIARAAALAKPLGDLARTRPVIIDESDADLEAFPAARKLGYSGVSSKACKGVYRSLLNRARCIRWNSEERHDRYFMSAEDLTTQAGVAVQQDLALATLIGCRHVERNGHHYVRGMAAALPEEQAEFLARHPDLYERADGVVRLRIRAGEIAIGSLACTGFACAAEPHWPAMRAMSYRE